MREGDSFPCYGNFRYESCPSDQIPILRRRIIREDIYEFWTLGAASFDVGFWHIASLQRVAEFGRCWSNSGLVRKGSEALGGKGGGGRPDMAQAGGPDGAKANAALSAIEQAMAGA